MAKRPPYLPELPKTPPKKKPLLSPSNISSVEEHATVTGLLASLSPVKPSRYFDAELTDGESLIRLVGFDKSKQRQLQPFSDYELPVTLKDCVIQKNKYSGNLEIVIKPYTKIEESHVNFEVKDLKTAGSESISLCQLNEMDEHQRVRVQVMVVKVHEPQKAGSKKKQDVLVADSSGRAVITLWEADINSLHEKKSYQLSRLEVREYKGKKHLSFPAASRSIDKISCIENIQLEFSSSDEDEEHVLHTVTVLATKELEAVYHCVNCNKNMDLSQPASQVVTCETCHSTQKVPDPRQTVKLLIDANGSRLTLKATDQIIKDIAQSENVTDPRDLLFAPPFTCHYSRYNNITKISRGHPD